MARSVLNAVGIYYLFAGSSDRLIDYLAQDSGFDERKSRSYVPTRNMVAHLYECCLLENFEHVLTHYWETDR